MYAPERKKTGGLSRMNPYEFYRGMPSLIYKCIIKVTSKESKIKLCIFKLNS